jgi:hypothetical protein
MKLIRPLQGIYVYVVVKEYWRIKYTLAPKFEANVYFSPKLQTSFYVKIIATEGYTF